MRKSMPDKQHRLCFVYINKHLNNQIIVHVILQLKTSFIKLVFAIPIEYCDIDDENNNESNNYEMNMDNQQTIIRVTPISGIRFADIKTHQNILNGIRMTYLKHQC